MNRDTTLKGKTAMVTGGGTGIGREIALGLAARGADVVVNYSHSLADAERTAREAIDLGVRARVIQADVSRDVEARSMVHEAAAELGGLDILVNNAGTTQFIPLQDLEAATDDVWDRIFAVNVKGAFHVSRAAAPLLRQRGGLIVNIASVAGINGAGSSIPYCASKAALISLTKSLARVLAPEVRVNAVAPGFTDTRWTEGQDEPRRGVLATTPLGRIAAPKDVAEVVLSLTTGSAFVTGQVIVVDGGRTM